MIKALIAKIRMALNARKAATKIKEAYVKEGIRSSEFWVTVVTWLSVLGSAALGMIDPALTVKILAGIAIVYTIARTVVKLTPSNRDNELLDKFEKILRDKGLLK